MKFGDYRKFDAVGLAELVANSDVSADELLDCALERAGEVNPKINAIIRNLEGEARAAIRNGLPAGPLAGVPYPIKDISVHMKGVPTGAGSRMFKDFVQPEESSIIALYRKAGLVLFAKTNTPEFGLACVTEPTANGITRNPWNLEHTSGGSSGGAAAAVAAGVVPAAHGSDGGGSIRIPASCCGLVGLKVGRGRVPALAQAWEGAAVEGVVSHTVADTAAVLDLISGPDRLGWWNAPAPERPFADEVGAPVEPRRIALVTDTARGLPTAPACVESAQRTADALASAGHEIVDVVPDFHIEEFIGHFLTVVNAGLAAYDDMVDWARVEEHNRVSRAAAGGVDSIAYAKAVAALQRWTRAVKAQWGEQFDVLVTPTMAIEPAPAGQILAEVQADPDGVSPTVLHSVLFTAVFNMNGLPAISLPVHQSDSGLPIGAQLVAGPWEESRLVRLSAQVEQLLPWNDRHPTLPL